MAIGGCTRNLQRFRRLFNAQPRKVPQLHQLGGLGILGSQSDERLIDGQQFSGHGRGHGVRLQEINPLSSSSVHDGRLPPGLLHEDPPHGLGRGRKEVAARLPALSLIRRDEPQIRLVDERRRLEGVSCRLLRHPRRGQPAQLIVHQRQQLLRRVGIAALNRRQDLGDAGHAHQITLRTVQATTGAADDQFGTMTPREIRRHCKLDADAESLLKTAMEEMGLSARAHDKILRVGRTIADLDRSAKITSGHLSEAINYRTLDRTYWAA